MEEGKVMRHRKIKVIYYSLRGSESSEVSLSSGELLGLLAGVFSITLLISAALLALLTDLFHDVRVASLLKENETLQQRYSEIGQKLTRIESRLKYLEKQDDDLRVFADLPKLDSDVREVGTGGYVREASFDLAPLPDALGEQISEITLLADKMERQIELFIESRREIERKLAEENQRIKHTPTIRPVIGGRITDKFGMRIDPFLSQRRHHNGVDIAIERGTEVYASANGVVERVVRRAQPNRGYGKQVIINHGYGVRTRYGHLSKILVRPGQKVSRWDPIGLVGDTGRATGPHLHYEVIVDGKQLDPFRFILN
jgi:murein DD-endopeptidase MepM/ murein hydrolase activator NlpD